jgi:hypothetical protein
MLILGVAIFVPAGFASEATPAGGSSASQRAAEREAIREQKELERSKRLGEREASRSARAETRTARRLAHKENEHVVVKIECTRITVEYRNFPAVSGSPNEIYSQLVLVKVPPGPAEQVSSKPTTYSFEGASSTTVIPIAAPVGFSRVVFHAHYMTNGIQGTISMHQPLLCDPAPTFSIEQTQSLGGSWTSAPLAGQVGQVVSYAVRVTNEGNTPLTFGSIAGTQCDANTIAGGSTSAVEPMGSIMFVCTHTLTAADAQAGSLVDVAKITGTPEAGEGPALTGESNAVLITPISAAASSTTTPTPVTPASSGSSGSSGTSGVLGFSSATVPALHGPKGCVRGPFTASIRATGVSSVIFYLDGRELKSLTATQAVNGLLSVRIRGAKLKRGKHRITAKITMTATSTTATAAKATRALVITRCRIKAAKR